MPRLEVRRRKQRKKKIRVPLLSAVMIKRGTEETVNENEKRDRELDGYA